MPWSTAKKDPAYGRADYRGKRLLCLRNAHWRCEIKIEGVCIGAASEADHQAGLAADPQHLSLRAACKPCHRSVTAQQGHNARGSGGDPEFTGGRTVW